MIANKELKRALFVLLCVISFSNVFSQEIISLGDTVRLSGVVIYDIKKDHYYFKIGAFEKKDWKKSDIKKIIKKKDYTYIDHPKMVASILRNEHRRINICHSDRTIEYINKDENLMYYKRYIIVVIKNDDFVELYLDGKNEGITLKCW